MERGMSGSEKPNFSDALAVGRELDLTLPDSRAVRDAYAQAETESQPWLFNHVMRSWLYGAKLAQHRGVASRAPRSRHVDEASSLTRTIVYPNWRFCGALQATFP